MFKRLALALVLAAVALEARAWGMGSTWMPDAYAEAPRLEIVFIDVEGTLPAAFAGLTREAGRILGNAGVDTRWRRGRPGTIVAGEQLTVVLMTTVGSQARIAPHVLGATLANAPDSRAAWLYLPHVAAALGLDPAHPGAWSAAEVSLMATALGRVAAHELIHVLAPQLPHSGGGLMAERLGRAALVGPRVELPRDVRQALRPAFVRRASVG
jgi:hypothetical protein